MQPLKVSEVTDNLRSLIEQNFRFVLIEGEISGFKYHSASGHSYFCLKDSKAMISAVLWSSRAHMLKFKLKDGMKVIVKGRITLFPSRGVYQVDVFEMQQFGLGDILAALEKLKEKLKEEGLFDEVHKKELPPYPERIAIVTSETGAVIQDFINVAKKRYPLVKILLFPVSVQGANTVFDVTKAIKSCCELIPVPDILVIARGGGSVEDLMPFNDERLVRAVFNCSIPTVSAVGHESDWTLCDLAADMRAPTPSAAAEMILPDRRELLENVDQYRYFFETTVNKRISELKRFIYNIQNHYIFNKPADLIKEYSFNIDRAQKQIESDFSRKLSSYKKQIISFEQVLNNINPEKTLKRGFSIIKKDGKIIKKAEELEASDIVELTLSTGSRQAEIK